MDKRVRVRYAPSPTGQLHIGGARTALFNYLYAKHYNGDFIVRIEDTDIERNIEGGELSQLENLEWLGITPDESPLKPGKYGPYRQTERLQTYKSYAQELINLGFAYECYCTPEELEFSRSLQEKEGNFSFRYDKKCSHLDQATKNKYIAEGRTPSIRYNIDPSAIYKWNDIVRGEISFEGKDISDWVIVKSNGIATYNFAVAIDDHLMEISHIFRGEEHISNTPKQMMIYNAFGWEIPQAGHMTLIVNEDRKKLSKRDETVMQFITQYKNEGYLPEALFNFFALLGWSPTVEEEIFSKEEIIKMFDEARLSKSPSMFDRKKLDWINNHYIKNTPYINIKDQVYAYLRSEYDLDSKTEAWLETLIKLYQPQLNNLHEIITLAKSFFLTRILSDDILNEIKENDSKQLFSVFRDKLITLEDFNAVNIKNLINESGKDCDKKGKKLFMPIRLACSFNKSGGDLVTVIELIGKNQVVDNLNLVISKL